MAKSKTQARVVSALHSSISAMGITAFAGFACDSAADVDDLARLGIDLSEGSWGQVASFAVDAAPDLSLISGMGVPLEYLRNWLPGFVHQLTTPRVADKLLGIDIVGNWEDEEIVQGAMELTGSARPYSDLQNVPLSSFAMSYESRNIVRFEEGFHVGNLERDRMKKAGIDPTTTKRDAAGLALEIQRNRVAMWGYNGGNNRTYGLLNDPALPAYETLPNGASGSSRWSTKTFMEITNDLRWMFGEMVNRTQGLVDPTKDALIFGIPFTASQFLSVDNEFGQTVRQWLKENYANLEIIAVPEFEDANGGTSVAYLYPLSIADGQSTDNGRVISQLVQVKYKLIGSEVKIKSYVEDAGNATAGVMTKRPYAVLRVTGI